MNNYVIEDGVNFWEELLKDDDNEDDEDTCLISDTKLVNNNITLTCGHKFNYEPLYNDVVQQKSSSNMESRTLLINQFRCPYCRTMQFKLLPSISGYAVRHGINSPLKYCMFLNKCSYVFKAGKRKGEQCGKLCNEQFCKQHTPVIPSDINENVEPASMENKCKAILKSGKRKGQVCCAKTQNGETYCKRHNK